MPIHFDQLDNAAKAERQGWGLRVPLVSGRVSADEIYKGLFRLLHEPSFTEHARRVSVRLRSRKNTPAQEAAGAACSVLQS
jgi:UDP:flavonoid glycosyltransferase YjiC (YdhE family)